jgi:hypothetical protein
MASPPRGRTFLPDHFLAGHDLCFLNHDVLAQLLVSGEQSGIFEHEFTFREQYTMSEIWDVFVNSLKKMQTALKTPLDHLTKLLDALKDLPKVRNSLAAHENEFAREFPLKVMRELAVNAIDLVSTLYCLQCRSFAVPVPNRQEPVMVHCKCMKVRYTMPETV